MSEVKERPLILLIENNDSDVFFFRRALSRCNFLGDVRVVVTAWQARNYLEGVGEFTDRNYYPIPRLIVCDLHLPGASGVDFIEWLRNSSRFKEIPIVLWSGSMPSADLQKVLGIGATAVELKTPDFQRLCSTLENLLRRFTS